MNAGTTTTVITAVWHSDGRYCRLCGEWKENTFYSEQELMKKTPRCKLCTRSSWIQVMRSKARIPKRKLRRRNDANKA